MADMDRNQIANVSGEFRRRQISAKTEIDDIDRQIRELQATRVTKEREAFVAEVKAKALRAAVRVMEDYDIV